MNLPSPTSPEEALTLALASLDEQTIEKCKERALAIFHENTEEEK